MPPITAFGNQPPQSDENPSGIARFALGAGAIAGLGFLPLRSGRVWDKYIAGIRAVETGFPAAILRTFRTSEFLSPLETYQAIGATGRELAGAGVYRQFLQQSLGLTDIQDIELRRTGLAFGDIYAGGKRIGMGLQIQAGTQEGTAIADYFARIKGVELAENESLNRALLRGRHQAFETAASYYDWLDSLSLSERQQRIILGAPFREQLEVFGFNVKVPKSLQRHLARVEVLTNLMRAKAATTTGRLNVLLSKPLEVPGIGGILKKLPFLRSAAVKPGTNLSMLGGYLKAGLAIGAAWKGLEYYDYVRSQGGVWSVALGTAGGGLAGALLARGPGRRFSPAGLAIGAGIGLYTAISPRFEHGLFHGVASIFTDINLMRARFSEAIGLGESLREQEAITPGLISAKTAIGFAGIGALTSGFYGYTGYLTQAASQRIVGGNKKPLADILDAVRKSRAQQYGAFWESGIGKRIAGLPKVGKYLSRVKHPMALGALGGLAAWGILSSGLSLLSGNFLASVPGLNLLGTEETPEELEAIYSGEQEIPVRHGRFWEMGRSPFEGTKIDYYRPHFIHRLKTRAYQKGLYGSEEEKWEYDPWLHPLKALFGSDEWKYHYEQKYMYERPAPLSGTYGEEIPFVGPLVAATIGKAIKPRKKVRPEEWELGGGQYVHHPDIKGEEEPAYELGGLGPGAPVAPEEASQLLNELIYKRREAVGLVGFAQGAIQEAITGREEYFQNLQTMATMGRETGAEYWLFDHLNVGGAGGSSEIVRRFIPHRRHYLEEYNPLRNALASWMPEDYFLDLKYGNPWDKIPEAEIRLPGPGYTALHPELEGIAPEEYPLYHRLKILADVAMWSDEYRAALSEAKRTLPDNMQERVREIERQVQARKLRREFNEYRFREEELEELQATVSEVLSPSRIKTKEFGEMIVELQGVGRVEEAEEAQRFAQETLGGNRITLMVPSLEERRYDKIALGPRMKAVAMIGDLDYGSLMAKQGLAANKELKDEFSQLRFAANERLAGELWETVGHQLETPLESLTPISPAAKLIRQRSAIEEYIKAEAIGTNAAFWNKPIENFLRPAASMAAYEAGIEDIPETVQERRSIIEYFDKLKWWKHAQLEAAARVAGQRKLAEEHRREKASTMFGVDVFGGPANIMRALPRRERDFFNEFVNAQTTEDRKQILSLIPAYEQRLYVSQWARQAEAAAFAKREAKIDTAEDNRLIAEMRLMRETEGFEYSAELEEQWLEETGGQIPFDEWVRLKKAEEYFSQHSLPDPSWLGFHPSVDMEDVKLKYVENRALDFHDFDLWGARERSLARKPYINEDMIAKMESHADATAIGTAILNAQMAGRVMGDRAAHVFASQAPGLENTYNINIKDRREKLIEDAYRQLGA